MRANSNIESTPQATTRLFFLLSTRAKEQIVEADPLPSRFQIAVTRQYKHDDLWLQRKYIRARITGFTRALHP